MTAVSTGKLIVRALPDGEERERIIDFLCSFANGVARETVAARLETLPLTLNNAMPADIGNNVLISLQNLGADVIFVHGGTDRSISQAMTVAETVQRPEAAPVKELETAAARKAARPVSRGGVMKDGQLNHDIRVLVILLLILVAGLCGVSAIWLPALKAASDPDLVLNKLLKKNAEMNNKACPRNINPRLRLDGYVAGNKKMTINYTLLAVSSTDVNGNELRPSLSSDIRQGVCNDQNSAELLKKDVAFVFVMHGNDGGLILDYQVVNEDCGS